MSKSKPNKITLCSVKYLVGQGEPPQNIFFNFFHAALVYLYCMPILLYNALFWGFS